jgi:hypothetical protein
MAERARQQLADWSRGHYGYRAEDVRQILAVLDEVVSELRAVQGGNRFDLSLVAGAVPPPSVPMLPPPTLQESIQQALTAAALAETSGDRVSLIQSAITLIDSSPAGLPAAWVGTTRAEASRVLSRELALTHEYVTLSSRTLSSARRAAARADVRGVERELVEVRRRSSRFAGQRPDELRALVAAIEERLDAARRLRLARDQWNAKAAALRTYHDSVRRPFAELARVRPLLDDIRTLAGPDAGGLTRLIERVTGSLARAQVVQPPAPAELVHRVLVSALQLAQNAGRLRQSAVSSGDVRMAWDASAAAAGALMLADRARADLQRVLEPPRLQ